MWIVIYVRYDSSTVSGGPVDPIDPPTVQPLSYGEGGIGNF